MKWYEELKKKKMDFLRSITKCQVSFQKIKNYASKKVFFFFFFFSNCFSDIHISLIHFCGLLFSIYVHFCICWAYSILISKSERCMCYVCANSPGNCGSIPGWIIPKTQKMVLDAALLNTEHYKVWINSKVEQSNGKE